MYRQHGQPRDLLHPGVGGTVHRLDHLEHGVGRGQQLIQVIPEHFNAEIRPDARDQLVEAHFNGLGNFPFISALISNGRAQFFD